MYACMYACTNAYNTVSCRCTRTRIPVGAEGHVTTKQKTKENRKKKQKTEKRKGEQQKKKKKEKEKRKKKLQITSPSASVRNSPTHTLSVSFPSRLYVSCPLSVSHLRDFLCVVLVGSILESEIRYCVHGRVPRTLALRENDSEIVKLFQK